MNFPHNKKHPSTLYNAHPRKSTTFDRSVCKYVLQRQMSLCKKPGSSEIRKSLALFSIKISTQISFRRLILKQQTLKAIDPSNPLWYETSRYYTENRNPLPHSGLPRDPVAIGINVPRGKEKHGKAAVQPFHQHRSN